MTTQINQLTELTSTSDGDLLLIRENATGVDKKMQASNLRAKATTKDDVGLGDVTNDAQLKIASNLSDLSNASTARTNLGLGDVDNVSAANLRDRSTHTGTQPLSTISDAGTMASQPANNVNIDGGVIDGTAIGGTTASTGNFTNASVSGALTANEIRPTSNQRIIGFDGITVGTSPTTIVPTAGFKGRVYVVNGFDGTQRFCDLLFASELASPVVIQSFSSRGSPAVRTYSRDSLTLQLSMASGSYAVEVIGIG